MSKFFMITPFYDYLLILLQLINKFTLWKHNIDFEFKFVTSIFGFVVDDTDNAFTCIEVILHLDIFGRTFTHIHERVWNI
ncbi:hypothetical protein RhiirC2_858721 [Rhizophagus irregularis]|uniref:Uncharacterized protein n=1 Tax=Rhizophagus irregularis TaxID=588596 RepID=A0A2N1M3G3_9GLOM|nr:hypothetical protein RhiirC2_858721 [Rhizophagus irregularis]